MYVPQSIYKQGHYKDEQEREEEARDIRRYKREQKGKQLGSTEI